LKMSDRLQLHSSSGGGGRGCRRRAPIAPIAPQYRVDGGLVARHAGYTAAMIGG
jgi:hypothetical protein